jgi:class 3 adenylate cyclase
MTALARLARQILVRLKQPGESAAVLLDAYHTRTAEHRRLWQEHPELYPPFVERLIQQGHPARALDLARERQEYLKANPPPGPPDPIPEGHRLRYLLAHAANRGGNPRLAEQLLRPLLAVARRPDRHIKGMPTELRVDVIALQGRILKDQSRRDPSLIPPAIAAYDEAARVPGAAQLPDGGTFPLINKATLLRLGGKEDEARKLAEEVIPRAERRVEAAAAAGKYWLAATLGEACVLAGRHEDAVTWYLRAVEGAEAAGDVGDVGSTLGNLLRLQEVGATRDSDWIEQRVGSLVVFSGHMIDSPDRLAKRGARPRFPNSALLVKDLDREIRARLEDMNATVGFSSLACGSDILFARAMLARKAELHVVLPFADKDFLRTSVDFGLTDDPGMRQWRRWFEGVLGDLPADNLHYATTEPYLGTRELFDFVNTFTQGLAVLRARQRVVKPKALVVHDPGSEVGALGTEYFRKTWKGAGLIEAEPIDLSKVRRNVPPDLPRVAPKPPPEPLGPELRRQVKAMLFADVSKFSGIPEDQLPRFLNQYVGFLKRVFGSSAGKRAVFVNTWGDGLYVVFDTVPEAAEFALSLLERAGEEGSVDWAGFGLGEGGVPLRVALHTGPVFEAPDLFGARPEYSGQHVNRTARIEPVTVRGCAYASEQFAAHLTMEAPGRFACEFVGIHTLPKDYDRCPLYHVTRA